jgi:hypothetical protein
MADEAAAPAAKPKNVKMPRAVHEIVTGKKSDEKIDAGELITDDVAKEHKLSDAAIERLVATGAVALVDVLTA